MMVPVPGARRRSQPVDGDDRSTGEGLVAFGDRVAADLYVDVLDRDLGREFHGARRRADNGVVGRVGRRSGVDREVDRHGDERALREHDGNGDLAEARVPLDHAGVTDADVRRGDDVERPSSTRTRHRRSRSRRTGRRACAPRVPGRPRATFTDRVDADRRGTDLDAVERDRHGALGNEAARGRDWHVRPRDLELSGGRSGLRHGGGRRSRACPPADRRRTRSRRAAATATSAGSSSAETRRSHE